MFRRLFAFINRYERHLSAAAMVAGFVADSLYFGRIDLASTELVFAAYAGIAGAAVLLLHAIEARGAQTGWRPRWRGLLPLATQFALGGFWSGFLVFYGRGAVISASWPFLLLLLAIFLGNEIWSRYHERLVFTALLYFFALYSWAIFALPIYTHHIGVLTFIESGGLAVAAFALFTFALRITGRERFSLDLWRIRAGALAILVVLNLAYFTNVLPPLPLAAKAAGIYHGVTHEPGAGYEASVEPGEPGWLLRALGATPTLRLAPGDSLYAYSAIFAPTALSAFVVHRWQHYDTAAGSWQTRFALSYPIEGGGDGGYRGYSAIVPKIAGRWRVSIETADGRVIARLPFTLAFASSTPATETITLP